MSICFLIKKASKRTSDRKSYWRLSRNALLPLLPVFFLAAACPAMAFPVSAAENAADDPRYTVLLPEGYDPQGSIRYPVLYLLPEDTTGPVPEALQEEVQELVRTEEVMDMLIVCPDLSFLEDERPVTTGEDFADSVLTGDLPDLRSALADIAADVDKAWLTAADPSARMAAGFGSGGFLALSAAMTDENGKLQRQPSLFGLAGCISGDFTSEENPWLSSLGSFRSVIDSGPLNNQILQNYYLYISSATEDPLTTAPDGAADVISSVLRRGPAYAGSYQDFYGNADETVLSLSLKNGEDDPSFRSRALKEMLAGFSGRLMRGTVSASLSLSPQAAHAEETQITADAKLLAGPDLTLYTEEIPADTELLFTITDPSGGTILDETILTGSEASAKLSGEFPGDRAEAVLSCRMFGIRKELARQPLLRIRQGGDLPENWFLDLAGTWKFTPVPFVTPGILPDAAEMESWEEVIPALTWWDSDFSEKTDMKGFSGYAWYAKTFSLPPEGPDDSYVLSLGCFDETDIVFINGTLAGATGMDPEKWRHREDCWDTERNYPVDPSVLRWGEDNTVLVLTHNQSGDGGWYDGHPMLYAKTAFEAEHGSSEEEDNGAFLSLELPSAWKAKMDKTGHETVPEHFLLYLPEGYDLPENADRRYPVIYLFHQLNSTSHSYVLDGIDRLVTEAIAEGTLPEVILVVPDSAPESWWMYGWDSMVTEELIPWVDARYRTIPDARFRVAAGASMGGHGAFYLAYRNPELFRSIVSWYGAINMGGNPLRIASNAGKDFLGYFRQYFICGNRDLYKFGLPSITLDSLLREANVPHFFELEEGEHDSSFYLPYAISSFAYQLNGMPFLSRQEASPSAEAESPVDNAAWDLADAPLTLQDVSIESHGEDAPAIAITFSADEALKALLPELPDAEADGLTKGTLQLPVRITLSKDGKILQTMEDILTIDESTELLDYTCEAPETDVPEDAEVEVTVWVFDRAYHLDTKL